MDWFRRHHGAPLNPRWRLIARRSGQPVAFVIAVWDLMEDNASRATPRGTLVGWDDEAAAIALDMEPEAVQAIREAMQGKALNVDVVMDWEITQPKREREDDSKERVRAFRERQRQETPKKPKSRRVTPRNATKRPDREIEEREEKETESPPERARAAQEDLELDRANKLVGWLSRQREDRGLPPLDSAERGKAAGIAKWICDNHSPERIRQAAKGIIQIWPFADPPFGEGRMFTMKDFKEKLTEAADACTNPPHPRTNGKPSVTGITSVPDDAVAEAIAARIRG